MPYIVLMFKLKNASPIKMSKIMAKNVKNNLFIIFASFKTNITSILLKNIVIYIIE